MHYVLKTADELPELGFSIVSRSFNGVRRGGRFARKHGGSGMRDADEEHRVHTSTLPYFSGRLKDIY